MLQSLVPSSRASTSDSKEVVVCLTEVLQLLIDSEGFDAQNQPSPSRYSMLDEAHMLKSKLQSILLQSDVYSPRTASRLASFDKLGLCLAAFVALDRTIRSLRPAMPSDEQSDDESTSALCAQLLQLELKTADGDPTTELVSAFRLAT